MLSVILAGVETQANTLAALVAHDGWGPAPQHIISRRGPLQHGETYEDYRLDPRHGVLIFKLPLIDLDAMYTARRTLSGVFLPRVRLSLKFAMPYGDRQIDGYALPAEMAWNVEQWAAQKVSYTIYCPDPSFYDPVGIGLTFDLGGGAGAGVIPMVVPMMVGTSILDAVNTVAYSGDLDSYPDLIRITGPITNCIITNAASGDTFDFTGTTIAAGDYYDIDCRYGYKTVVDSTGANKIATLTSDSDLATFRFLAAVDGSGVRNNSISVTGSSVTGATKVELSFFTRYGGI